MRIHRRTEASVKLTETEFLEALGLQDEAGGITEITKTYDENFIRYGSGANVIEIKLVKHSHAKRKPRPQRKR